MKNKIVYVPESFPQPSETFVINEIDGLLGLGYKITVVPRITGCSDEINHARLKKILKRISISIENSRLDLRALYFGLRYGGQIKYGLSPKAVLRRVKKSIEIARHVTRIKAENPDIIIIHFGYDNAIAGAIAANFLGVPSILWLHGSDMHTIPHRSLLWLTGKVSKVITNSNYSASLLSCLGVRSCVDVSYLGVDLNKFKLQTIKNKHHRPVIICVARLGHSKNHKVLLQVFRKLKKQLPNAELWLVGDGPNRNDYENLVSELHLQGVVFFGALPQEQIVELLQQSWIKVLLSEKEGLGVALIEAQAVGLPCVASSEGGIPEVIKAGETGFLFDLNSKDFEIKVVDTIGELLTDTKLREKMGFSARQRVERLFNEKAHIERMDLIIKTLQEQR